eukprot:GILI01010223.1.p1 GENE.GILI01010223.1~~GILI01010223.1.p1  ORF type:complete len:770 (-),score=83.31 GILI01010223.1:752-3061(-)
MQRQNTNGNTISSSSCFVSTSSGTTSTLGSYERKSEYADSPETKAANGGNKKNSDSNISTGPMTFVCEAARILPHPPSHVPRFHIGFYPPTLGTANKKIDPPQLETRFNFGISFNESELIEPTPLALHDELRNGSEVFPYSDDVLGDTATFVEERSQSSLLPPVAMSATDLQGQTSSVPPPQFNVAEPSDTLLRLLGGAAQPVANDDPHSNLSYRTNNTAASATYFNRGAGLLTRTGQHRSDAGQALESNPAVSLGTVPSGAGTWSQSSYGRSDQLYNHNNNFDSVAECLQLDNNNNPLGEGADGVVSSTSIATSSSADLGLPAVTNSISGDFIFQVPSSTFGANPHAISIGRLREPTGDIGGYLAGNTDLSGSVRSAPGNGNVGLGAFYASLGPTATKRFIESSAEHRSDGFAMERNVTDNTQNAVMASRAMTLEVTSSNPLHAPCASPALVSASERDSEAVNGESDSRRGTVAGTGIGAREGRQASVSFHPSVDAQTPVLLSAAGSPTRGMVVSGNGSPSFSGSLGSGRSLVRRRLGSENGTSLSVRARTGPLDTFLGYTNEEAASVQRLGQSSDLATSFSARGGTGTSFAASSISALAAGRFSSPSKSMTRVSRANQAEEGSEAFQSPFMTPFPTIVSRVEAPADGDFIEVAPLEIVGAKLSSPWPPPPLAILSQITASHESTDDNVATVNVATNAEQKCDESANQSFSDPFALNLQPPVYFPGPPKRTLPRRRTPASPRLASASEESKTEGFEASPKDAFDLEKY